MITYRIPDASDAAALAALSRETFVATFGTLYSDEDLNAFLDEHKTGAAFAKTLSDGRHRFLVAETYDQMVGYCKLGLDITLDLAPEWRQSIELKELYLRDTVQGTGVGNTLMDWALEQARGLSAPTMALSVWSENFRAQRFYHRYGFRHIADTIFMVGKQADKEFLYGLNLEGSAE